MNGTSLVITYQTAMSAGLPFPQIPDVNTMINLNHTSKPIFYGCYDPTVPLVLYAADYPYSAYTNISFTATNLTQTQVTMLTDNGLSLISQANNTLAADWSTCLACASVQRSMERMGWSMPDICYTCQKRYCWGGTVDDASPSFLEPGLALRPGLSWVDWNATVFY